jgi:hypothetical protein
MYFKGLESTESKTSPPSRVSIENILKLNSPKNIMENGLESSNVKKETSSKPNAPFRSLLVKYKYKNKGKVSPAVIFVPIARPSNSPSSQV